MQDFLDSAGRHEDDFGGSDARAGDAQGRRGKG
jgi:hypothetical protein